MVWWTGAVTLLAALQTLIPTLPEQGWSIPVFLGVSTRAWTIATGEAANRVLRSTGSSTGSKTWWTVLRVDLDKTDCCIELLKEVTVTVTPKFDGQAATAP